MEGSENLKGKTTAWTFAVLGEGAAVTLLNLLPYIMKRLFEKEEFFWLNAVFGVPFVFLSIFMLCVFKAANRRRLFGRLCEKKSAPLGKSSFSGSAVLSLVVLLFKAALLFLFMLPAAAMTAAALYVAESFPIEATVGLFAFCLILSVVGILFFRKACSLLFLAEYVYLVHPNMNSAECIRLSAERVSACRREWRRLSRRLFASRLLCVFVFTVPYALHRCRLLKNSLAFDLLFVPVR